MLEFANATVPDILKKAVNPAFDTFELLKRMRERGRVERTGGTKVQIIRIKSKHSNISRINSTNLQVDLSSQQTTSTLEGDWGKLVKPIVIPHIDSDRFSKEEVKAHIKRITEAAVQTFRNDVVQQLLLGDMTELADIGTLNGNVSGLASTGLERGALRFQSPADQATAAIAYLGQTRLNDTTNQVDHWHNQFAAHTGLGTDALPAIETAKATADTFAEEGAADIGILSIADHTSLSQEVRSSPGGGGQAAVVYTAADAAAGKINTPILMHSGVQFFPNRWMTAARLSSTEGIYVVNAMSMKYWVNAKNDFRMTPFVDFLTTTGLDADVAFCNLEIQFACENILCNATVSQ